MSKLGQQWLEVFRAGDYKDKGAYSIADLDEMVANYDPKFHEAPVVVGHPQDNKPAYGWVESLKRIGNTLFAKLKDVDEKFEELVQTGKFKKRSISFYREPKLMLRHIGFLGAMPPEVKGLVDPVFHDDKAFVLVELSEGEDMDPKAIAQAVKDAFTDLFGGKKPSTFSEDDVTNMVTKAVEKATTAMATTLTNLQTQLTAFADSAKNVATSATIKAQVDSLIAPLKAANKWVPAFDELHLRNVIEHLVLDTTTKVSFGEGAKKVEKTLAETFCEFLGALPAIVPMAELTRGASAVTKGTLVKFNDSHDSSIAVVGADLAEAAQALSIEKKISYGDALRQVRAQGIREGGASAGAV